MSNVVCGAQLWSISKSRNLKLFEDIDDDITKIYQHAATIVNQWLWTNLNG